MIQGLPEVVAQDEYYAAVDLGSNSFHMVIVKVLSGSVHIVSKTKQKVRLAAGLDDNFVLNEESIERGLHCLRTFADKLDDIPQAQVKVVATATLRLAKNADSFIERANEILHHPINIISGEEEAKQIFLGVAYTSANHGNSLVIDIGGASTEVIIGKDMQPLHLISLNMGCVTFMEHYFKDGLLSEENFATAEQQALAELEPHAATFLCFDWHQCLGASGTPQAVTSILVKQGINDAIRLRYLLDLKNKCIDCGHIDKLNIEGLPDARTAIFPSGLSILIAIFTRLEIDNMQISGGALREGIIYGMLDKYQRHDRRAQGLNQLISRFHIDIEQSERVRTQAVNLCRQMCLQKQVCDLDTEEIIGAAAALHELGLHIGYKKFHEHGAYILTHVELTGFTQLQRMMIRDLVLCHRQEINFRAFEHYQPHMLPMLESALRIVRIAVIFATRRKNNVLPSVKLRIDNDHWSLIFDKGFLKNNALMHTELIHETWLQHKAGWKLELMS